MATLLAFDAPSDAARDLLAPSASRSPRPVSSVSAGVLREAPAAYELQPPPGPLPESRATTPATSADALREQARWYREQAADVARSARDLAEAADAAAAHGLPQSTRHADRLRRRVAECERDVLRFTRLAERLEQAAIVTPPTVATSAPFPSPDRAVSAPSTPRNDAAMATPRGDAPFAPRRG